MKSQLLTVLFLIISTHFFQPAHQHRVLKRELTEYDLTNFIVGTCSADKIDMLIKNLCDQTLHSARNGTFAYLTYYCQRFGAGMKYCSNVNRHTVTNQNAGNKRFVSRRLARSLNKDKQLYQNRQEMNIDSDLEQKLIMQMCIIQATKNSVNMDQFCERKLQEVQQGRYPEIQRLCKLYPGFEYCQHVQSYSSVFSWPLSESSAVLSPTHPIPSDTKPPLVSSSVSKSSETGSISDQDTIDKQKQESPPL